MLRGKLEAGQRRNLKNFLINPKYQVRYVLWITMTGLILILVNAYIFYTYTRENYTILVDLSPMTDDVKALLYKELNEIVALLTGFSILFLVVVSFLGFVVSHKTAGPLYHFKRVFEEIRAGNKNARIRLRPKDDFKDVAGAFNKMMDDMDAPTKQ